MAVDFFQQNYLHTRDSSMVEINRELRNVLDRYVKACDNDSDWDIKNKEVALLLQTTLRYKLSNKQEESNQLFAIDSWMPDWFNADDFYGVMKSAKARLDEKSEWLSFVFDLYATAVEHYEGVDYFASVKKINFDKLRALIEKMKEGGFAKKDYYLIPNMAFGINAPVLFATTIFLFLDIFMQRITSEDVNYPAEEVFQLKRHVFYLRVFFYENMPDLENMLDRVLLVQLREVASKALQKVNIDYLDFVANRVKDKSIDSKVQDAFKKWQAYEERQEPALFNDFKSSLVSIIHENNMDLDKNHYKQFLSMIDRVMDLQMNSSTRMFVGQELKSVFSILTKVIILIDKYVAEETEPFQSKVSTLLSYLVKSRQTIGDYYDKKFLDTHLLSKNNYQYLNEIYKNFDMAELERFFKLNQLTQQQYDDFTIIIGNDKFNTVNLMQQFVMALNRYLLCLINEFKEREMAGHDQWVEKYTAMLNFAKVFYRWPVVSYATEVDQVMIDNELTRLAPKPSHKAMSTSAAPKKKKEKPVESPQSAPVIVQAQSKSKKIKRVILTPAQLAIQKAKNELKQEALQQEQLKQEEMKLTLPDYVIDILMKLGENAYLVGGATRDSHPNDYDIVVSGLTETEVAEKLGANNWVGKNHRVFEINGNEERKPIQVSIMKQTIQLDADGRDFSCNARYYNWHENKFYDFHGSEDAIKNKIIKFIGDADQRIQQDPSRVFRALRLMMDGYRLEGALTEDDIKGIAKLNGDKRHYELMKSLRSDSSNKIFGLLNQYDVLVNGYSLSKLEASWCMRRWEFLMQYHPNPNVRHDNDLLALTLFFPLILKNQQTYLKSAPQLLSDLRMYGLSPKKEQGEFFVNVICYFLQIKVNLLMPLNNDPYYFPFLVDTFNSYQQEVVNHSSVNPNSLYGQVSAVVALPAVLPQCNQ